MVKIQLYPQGTQVRIRPGRFPFDLALAGRSGTVLHLLKGGYRYGVQLDGDEGVQVFSEDELVPYMYTFNAAEAGEPRGGSGSDSPS